MFVVRANFGRLFCVASVDNFLSNVRRDFFVSEELHRRSGTALRHTTEVRGVAEEVAERAEGADDFGATGEVFHFVDATTTRVDVADDVAHELFWGGDF